jgi:epoxyqueuosine reductase
VISSDQISQAVTHAAAEAGFELAGIASVREEDFAELDAFVEWIDGGNAGEMRYLEKRTESGALRRASAKNAAPWARSVVVCGLNYNTDQPYSTQVHDPSRGWISRYAWGNRDYHHAVKDRLQTVEAAIQELALQQKVEALTRSYVDTGPIVERVYAKYAGLGWIGKNTCLIHQKQGSFFFLGVILTSLDLVPGGPAPDRCGSCTRCIEACPTQAIVAPGKLDARRCISYLTIEKRGEIPLELREGLGQHVFGCDICQDVCPWNNKPGNAPFTLAPEFQARPGLFHPDLDWLAAMDEEPFQETFRESPVKRAKYAGLKRNVAIAMGNSGRKEFVPRLEKMAAGADPVLAEHAQWALEKLRAAQLPAKSAAQSDDDY